MPIRGACAASPPLLAAPHHRRGGPSPPTTRLSSTFPPPLGPFFAGQGRDTEELCPSLDISRPERVCRPPSPLHPPSQRLHQHHQPATNKFASRIGRHSVTAVHSQSSIGITIVPPPWEFTHSSWREEWGRCPWQPGQLFSLPLPLSRSPAMSTFDTRRGLDDHRPLAHEDGFGGSV